MASHYHHCHLNRHHVNYHQRPIPSTPKCCCNHHQPPPPSTDLLVQLIASLPSQCDPISTQCPKFHNHNLVNQNQYQTHSTISSLLRRIQALESSLHHFSSHNTYHSSSSSSLRDTAARIIQTHFRAFLVRRSRTLRNLKDLAFIKSSFNSLKSTFSNDTHVDFAALSRKAMDLLLKLDSVEGSDPMIRDGKRSISKGLVQFLDSIEGVAVKKHWRYVKATKNGRFGESLNKSRAWGSKHGNSGDDQSKLLQNLRDRVEKISRLCKFYAHGDDDKDGAEVERINHVADEDGGSNVLISRRNGVTSTKNGVFVQPKVKKSVSFAENGNISKVYSSTYEPALGSDEMGELVENISLEDEDVMDSSHGDEDGEEG